VADAIISYGSFTNCTLPGTSWTIFDLDPATAINRGLDNAFGFYFSVAVGVGDVQVNDICNAVDGITVRDFADFFSYISLYKSVGDTVRLSIIRGSGPSITHLEISLTLISGWLDY
jgi:S1-C subfamily serine protease